MSWQYILTVLSMTWGIKAHILSRLPGVNYAVRGDNIYFQYNSPQPDQINGRRHPQVSVQFATLITIWIKEGLHTLV